MDQEWFLSRKREFGGLDKLMVGLAMIGNAISIKFSGPGRSGSGFPPDIGKISPFNIQSYS